MPHCAPLPPQQQAQEEVAQQPHQWRAMTAQPNQEPRGHSRPPMSAGLRRQGQQRMRQQRRHAGARERTCLRRRRLLQMRKLCRMPCSRRSCRRSGTSLLRGNVRPAVASMQQTMRKPRTTKGRRSPRRGHRPRRAAGASRLYTGMCFGVVVGWLYEAAQMV